MTGTQTQQAQGAKDRALLLRGRETGLERSGLAGWGWGEERGAGTWDGEEGMTFLSLPIPGRGPSGGLWGTRNLRDLGEETAWLGPDWSLGT